MSALLYVHVNLFNQAVWYFSGKENSVGLEKLECIVQRSFVYRDYVASR